MINTVETMSSQDNQLSWADNKANSRQFIQNAIESALSLGDFQKEIHNECTPQIIISKTVERIAHLVHFEASAIYLVDEETSDLQMSVCMPSSFENSMEEEFEFMIQNGFVAWAIRERRGILVFSKDGSRQILLHVMATYSRARGLYIGIFPSQLSSLPDGSMEILSLIIRNAANCIESLIYSTMMRNQQKHLKAQVEHKTRELIRYEKQLVQAQNMEAIATLAGGVAHQFNNALTGLIGNLDLISMTVQNDAKVLSYIERTRPIVERMSKLSSQLLDYARGGKYMTQSITLKVLFNEIVPVIQLTLKKTVALTIELTDEPTTVDVDLVQMRTAILAIIKNADEAIFDKGSVKISGQCFQWHEIPEEIRSELKPGEYAFICFTDDGKGMDGKTLRRVFEPFFSTKFEGRGLSMAATSGIIKNHHGYIHVSSQINKGTQVGVYLPNISSDKVFHR